MQILDVLRQSYFSNLYVSDEGEYYENRDVHRLSEKIRFLRTAISSMAEGLKDHGLREEAAEDPNILATRVQRIAMLVHQKMNVDKLSPTRPAFDPTEDFPWSEPSPKNNRNGFTMTSNLSKSSFTS